jgi:HD-like signal output (HDOD) protein
MTTVTENTPENAALSHEELQKVVATIDIPVCPAIVTQAMAEAQKDEPDLRKLAALITADPSMSAAALKLANSVLYRSGTPISSVRNAVERLGTKIVVCVVVAVALRSSVDGLPAVWLDKFWRRATQTAVVSGLVARRQFGISPDAAYTYALFHDAAIPMMMKRFKEYEQVMTKAKAEGKMLVDAESSYFPCTHPVVASLMVRNWGLPSILGQAIRFHHEPDVYELPDQSLPGSALSLIAVTHIAEHLTAEELGEHDFEVGIELFEKALTFIGISENELDELRQRVVLALEEA